MSAIDRSFITFCLKLFKKRRTEMVVHTKVDQDGQLDVEIRFPSLNKVGFRVRCDTGPIQQHSELEQHPGSFGDSQMEVARNMKDWFPGKTTRWSTRARTFSIQGWNLPSQSMPDYTATLNYNSQAVSSFSPSREAEQILRLIADCTRKQKFQAEREKEQRIESEMKRTFDSLMN